MLFLLLSLLNFLYTEISRVCTFMSKILKFAPQIERTVGAITRGERNKMAVVFTHFLTQKSTHLSRAADSGHDFLKFVYKLKKSADGSVAVKSASQ